MAAPFAAKKAQSARAANANAPSARVIPFGFRPSAKQIEALRAHADATLATLREDRQYYFLAWREVAEYLLPYRYRWLISPNQWNRNAVNQRIIDSTSKVALRTLTAGMMGGMTSPGRPWFRVTLHNPDLADLVPVKRWCAEVGRRILMVMGASNYYQAKATQWGDLASFGTAPMLIYEDFEDVIRCFNPCAGEYFVANSKRGDIDTFYREYCWSIAATVREYGEDRVTPGVLAAFQRGRGAQAAQVKICHAIEPNDDLGGLGGVVPERFKWRELFWEAGSPPDCYLAVRGYLEYPVTCPRWDLVGNDPYGVSPGLEALGDLKQLQVEQKRKAQGIEKQFNPPMLADVQLKNEPASSLPGGITYVTNLSTGGMKPAYEVKPDLTGLIADIADVRERLRNVFFNNIFARFSDLQGDRRTATEIDAKREENLIQLGPMLERAQNESLDPDINRIYAIMGRAGLIPPAPREIAGMDIKIEYTSVLAQAQRAASTVAIEKLFSFIGSLAGAFPEALDKVDIDAAIDEYADALGANPTILRSALETARIRAAKAQAAQQQQMAAAIPGAVDAAKNLSQTDVGGGLNALQMMTGLNQRAAA